MKPEFAKSMEAFRFAGRCVVVSVLSAVVYLWFSQISDVRGAAGGVGIMASLVGSGVAFWFALRSMKRKLIALALTSLLPLGFWCWTIFKNVYGN